MVDFSSVRRAGDDGVRVVIAGDFRRGCSAEPHIFQAGACVIAGTGKSAAARCFTGAEIASGGAVAVSGGVAYGIVPDGIRSVELSWKGGSGAASVQDNVYAVPLQGAPDAPVRMRFS